MTDIVERLRDYRGGDVSAWNAMEEAAAEIERLRGLNAQYLTALEDIASGRHSHIMLTSYPPQDAAVSRARTALENDVRITAQPATLRQASGGDA